MRSHPTRRFLVLVLGLALVGAGCGSVAPAPPAGLDGGGTAGDGGTLADGGGGGTGDGGTITDGGTTDGGTVTDGGTTDGGTVTDGGTTDGGTVACAADPASAVTATSSCLTLNAGAQAVVAVSLVDGNGNPLTGATVTFTTTGDPATWVEPAVVESAGKPGTYYRTLASPTGGTSTTVTVDASACGQDVTLTQTVTVTYAPAVAFAAGGTGGCSPQDGNVRVRVVAAETGQPIQGAFVMVGNQPDPAAFTSDYETWLTGGTPGQANTATTDAQGYAIFSDVNSGLDGAKTITAGAANRAYTTLEGVGTSDVVLPLPLTSPAITTSSLQGTSTPAYTTNNDNNVEVALVGPPQGLGAFADFSLGDLLETDRPATVGGNGCFVNQTLNIPGNVEVPAQSVGACQITATPPEWTVTVPQAASTDLLSIQAHANAFAVGGGGTTGLLAALQLDQLGLLTGQDATADHTGLAIDLTAALTGTMPTVITGAPRGDLFTFALGDLDGNNGTGRLAIEGLSVLRNRTTGTPTLTTAAASGAFAGMRHLAAVVDRINGGGTSTIFDRVTTGATARRTFQGFFTAPQAAITGATFHWNDVHTQQSPPDYSLARSVLARLTPLNAYQDRSEPFWIVYTPAGTRSFALPTLPSTAPRAADNGYLVPDATANQTNRWHLGLYYLGLAPGTVDLASYDFSSTIPEVTQTASDDLTLP